MARENRGLNNYLQQMLPIRPYDFRDKEMAVKNYVTYMLMRTRQMFQYENLPETIPENMLELMLQVGGTACITEVDGRLYVLQGGWGGEPDAYYRGKLYVVANPALNFSKSLEIGKDCVLIYNDSYYFGLKAMFERYATQLAENDISINIADIMARCITLITAGDDRTKASAEKYLIDIADGKLGVLGNNAVLESLKTLPYENSAHQTITDLIELHQYIKASWFNEMGLSANYNMKREAINSSEAQLGEDSLLPLIDDMLHCREEWVAQVNALYGTDIKVSLHSSWNHVEDDLTDEAEPTAEVQEEEGTEDDKTTEVEAVTEVEREATEQDEPEASDKIIEEVTKEEDREVDPDTEVIEVPVSDKEVEEANEDETE